MSAALEHPQHILGQRFGRNRAPRPDSRRQVTDRLCGGLQLSLAIDAIGVRARQSIAHKARHDQDNQG